MTTSIVTRVPRLARPGDDVGQMRRVPVQVSRKLREQVRERKQNLTLRMEPSRVIDSGRRTA